MIKNYKNLSAIILAGGESKRIGENKALLKVGDKTIIEIIAHKIINVFSEVFISANDNSIYSFLNLPIINDIYKNYGPLSGIHAALINSKTDKNFFISCDLPLINSDSINYIIEQSKSFQITIPLIKGYPLYVCGVYSKNILNSIEKLLKDRSQNASLKNLTKEVDTNFINIEKEKFYNENIFINMNTKDDFELVRKIFLDNYDKEKK